MRIEEILWYISLGVIVIISLYTMVAYFGGDIGSFDVLAILAVTYSSFGFLIAISLYLGGKRKSGWKPGDQPGNLGNFIASGSRKKSIIGDIGTSRIDYGIYKKILLILVVIGFLFMLSSPVFGLLLIVIAAGSYFLLVVVRTFEPGEE